MRTILFFCIIISSFTVCAVVTFGDDFTIGAYYMVVGADNNFDYDYGFMDLARNGANFVTVMGGALNNSSIWASLKHWGMTGTFAYNRLNGYGPGWDPCDMVSDIIYERNLYNGMYYNGEYVGDAYVGHVMQDEPECGDGLTEDQKNFLRAYADIYHQYNPDRKIYVNHCDPPWYDLHEKQATCSVSYTISVNGSRINDRIQAARNIGLENFTVVNLPVPLWIAMGGEYGGNETSINYVGLGPFSEDVMNWLATRTNYQDVYEYMLTACNFGAKGFTVYCYNNYSILYSISLVDPNGFDNNGKLTGFGDAAHDIRRSQGWPGVDLFNNGVAFNDRGTYPAGDFTLTAAAESSSGTIEKVVFGKSIDGGGIWETIEDTTAPYSATFSTSAGNTVIFRARAVDTDGKKSIYAANMIYID